jgi:ATP citrate (pro-S)-lyase
VDAKAEKLLIPVDLSEYPSNAEIAGTLLKKIPKGIHNVLVDFITRLYAVYVDCQFSYLEINPLVVIPNEDATSASVHFLDLAAKLDQTADFEVCCPGAMEYGLCVTDADYHSAVRNGLSLGRRPPLAWLQWRQRQPV